MNFEITLNFVLEISAVFFAICYLLLAIKQIIYCWPAWIISSLLYFFVMLEADLFMEARLQIFYIVMGFYGWQQWRKPTQTQYFYVGTWNVKNHIFAISLIVLLSLVSANILIKFTTAALPFLDALTTWGAIIATYMVAKKILENWFYWFFIDSISVYLFLSRDLYFTSALFVIYLILIVIGYNSWNKIKKNQTT